MPTAKGIATIGKIVTWIFIIYIVVFVFTSPVESAHIVKGWGLSAFHVAVVFVKALFK